MDGNAPGNSVARVPGPQRPGKSSGRSRLRGLALGDSRYSLWQSGQISGGWTMSIIAWIVFGALAGLVAGFLTGRRGGIIYDIIVGIVGALLGTYRMGKGSHGVHRQDN